jgi:hypothetical protein
MNATLRLLKHQITKHIKPSRTSPPYIENCQKELPGTWQAPGNWILDGM